MAIGCPSCGKLLPDGAQFCDGCGAKVSVPVQPVSYAPYIPAPTRKTSWVDAFTIIGFVSSVVGLFWCAILLLPVGGIFSGLGFRSDKSKALAIAGLVISVVGLLIRLCVILYESGILPAWFTTGVL